MGSLFGAPPDQNITIDGENFTIPGTFEENLNVSKNKTVDDYYFFNTTTYTKGFINKTNYINILIFDYKGTDLDVDLINYMNGTSKKVAGEQGYMSKDSAGYTFSYSKDNKVISVQSDSEDIISSVIA